MSRSRRTVVSRSLIVLAALAAVALPGWVRADFDERHEVAAESLVVRNLIGEITVEGHAGSAFEIEVKAQGRDVNRDDLVIELRRGSRAELNVRFPVEDEKRYVYPRLGRGSTTVLSRTERHGFLSVLLDMLGGRGSGIKVTGSGRGVEMWADITIRVPRGADTSVELGVGKIAASDLEGDTTLATRSGGITARSVRGALRVDTGSGSIEVEDVNGDLVADTGSGSVDVRRVEGDDVGVDTGSGSIRLEAVTARSILLDTGSGRVTAEGLDADDVLVDTGSGSVTLAFDRLGDGRVRVDTGSGSIRLELPADASARIVAETNSGGIDADVDGARMVRRKRDEAEITLGGGAARIELDTGSGSIRIRQRHGGA